MGDQIVIKNINVFNEVAFIHTDKLDSVGELIDKDCATSLKYLNAIYAAGPADVYDAMIETFATVKQNHQSKTSDKTNPIVADSYII